MPPIEAPRSAISAFAVLFFLAWIATASGAGMGKASSDAHLKKKKKNVSWLSRMARYASSTRERVLDAYRAIRDGLETRIMARFRKMSVR